MSHTACCPERRAQRPPTPPAIGLERASPRGIRVPVYYEPLPTVQERKLLMLAFMQRIEAVRERLDALRQYHEAAAPPFVMMLS